MGAQNAWTTRSSVKASTVIIGANLQKVNGGEREGKTGGERERRRKEAAREKEGMWGMGGS
jgi:hypothetical protein